jgi:hypothetical protein
MHDVFAGDHHECRSNPANGKEKEKDIHQDCPSIGAEKVEQP